MSVLHRRAIAACAASAAAAALLLPGSAGACSVCGTGSEETRVAFLVTTGLLSVLPLALVGGLLWRLRARFRALEEAVHVDRAAAHPGAPDARPQPTQR